VVICGSLYGPFNTIYSEMYLNVQLVLYPFLDLVGEWLYNSKSEHFQLHFFGMMFALHRQTNMLCWNFYCASSLKQYSTVRHVAPPEHNIMIPIPPVFALWTQRRCSQYQFDDLGLGPTIYSTWSEHAHYYNSDAVLPNLSGYKYTI
jgi:hypothetical protein